MGQTQQAVAEAAAGVFGGYRPGPAAGQDGGHDHALWKELARAGLLGLDVPGWLGGEGLGVADTAVLLTEAGRAAAPVPALATLAMGVLPVTRWGSRDQQQALLAGVAAGDALLTAAVRETSEPMPPGPATTVTPDGGTVSGVKVGVPHAAAASWILVPASLGPGGTGIAVVAPSAPGWRRTGSRRRRPRRCGPATTCTAAPAWTSATRCTGTPRWPRTWSAWSAAPTTGSAASAPGSGEAACSL